MALLAFATIIVAVVASRTLLPAMGAIPTDHVRDLTQAQALTDDIDRTISSARGFLLTNDQRFLEESRRARRDFSVKLERLRALESTESGRRLLERVEEAERDHQATLDQALARRLTGGNQREVAGILESEVSPRQAVLERAIHSLMSDKEARLADAQQLARERTGMAHRLITIVAGIAVVSILVIVLLLRKTLLRLYSFDARAREARENTRLIVENALDAVITTDSQGVITGWNREAEKMFGWPASEVADKPLHETILPPDYRETYLEALRRYVSTGRGALLNRRFDMRALRRDGTEFPVELAITSFHQGESIFFSAFVRDISQRVMAEEARKQVEDGRERLLRRERAARSEAERTSRMKDEFLATLSHELRTPLQAILGWSRLLASEALDAEKTRQGIEVIERNAGLQTRLIEELLDMSRVMTGKVHLDVQRVELGSIIATSIETVRPSAEANGIRVESIIDPRAGPMMGDPHRVQQVVANLLSNAIKFTPRGGRVQVSLAQVDSSLRLTVSDTGRGIRREFLPHVFERFRQEDPSATRKHGGLGIGLALVRHLVELHGGKVSVKSRGEGQGTTFTVHLPLDAVRPSEAEEDSGDVSKTHEAEVSTPAAVDLAGLKILVVDDEKDNCELLRQVFADSGATVATADSVRAALESFGKFRPDVLVSDIGMPEQDGYELIRRIRALAPDRGGRVPAIAFTAFAGSEDRALAMRAGYQAHLAKPVEPTALVDTVARLAHITGNGHPHAPEGGGHGRYRQAG